MKLFKLLFFVSIFALTSCSDDDPVSTCTQSDWVGTYTGTIDCDGTMEDVTVNITASGTDAIVIKYETDTQETEYDPLTPDACKIENSGTLGGITASVDLTLDGDNLTLIETLSGGGVTSNCDLTATRQ